MAYVLYVSHLEQPGAIIVWGEMVVEIQTITSVCLEQFLNWYFLENCCYFLNLVFLEQNEK